MRVTQNLLLDPHLVPSPHGSHVTEAAGSGNPVPPWPPVNPLNCLETERQAWEDAGFSAVVITTALASRQDSTHALYQSRWAACAEWCQRQRVDPVSLSMTKVLDFLQRKSCSVRFNTIQGYVTAISHRHTRVGHKKIPISRMQCVKTCVKDLKQLIGVPSIIIPPWNLEVVLSTLKEWLGLKCRSQVYYLEDLVPVADHLS